MPTAVENLTKIPGFMRAMNWPKAALLMERWFNGRANSDPALGTADTSTITIDPWAFSFFRARDAFNTLLADKLWVNDNAKALIKKRLQAAGMTPGKPLTFGDLSQPPKTLDAGYLTFRVVGSVTDPFDDMYGALGKFTFRVAVQGQAVPVAGKAQHSVVIDTVGIYIRDTYDFNGDQPLGFWNFSTGQVSRLPGFGYDYIENKTFRDWRATNNRGGDFLVFSELKKIARTPPDTFIVDG